MSEKEWDELGYKIREAINNRLKSIDEIMWESIEEIVNPYAWYWIRNW